MKLRGSSVVAGSTLFTQASINAGELTYDAPLASGDYSFAFSVSDGYSSTAGVYSIHVTPAIVNSHLRIANYNLASSGDTGIPRTGLITLLQAFGNETINSLSRAVDLFIFQEVRSQATTTQYIVDQLNGVYGSDTYARGNLNGSSTGAGTMGVVYNKNTLQLLSEAAIGTVSSVTRQSMRYFFRPIGGVGNSEFYVYANHLKASQGSAEEQQRLEEVGFVRADADSLGQGANIIYAGDLNVYGSNEPAFQRFLSAGNGQAFDPKNRLGNWSNNSAFLDVHTQAPNANPPGGLVGGGLDDRFDFQLLSGEFTDQNGLEYIPNSYHTFGNNGSVSLNSSINVGSNTALAGLSNRQQVLDLLTTVSDHLPVIADYVFPTLINSAPNIDPQSFSVAENSSNGTVVGTVVATDPDSGDTLSFSITGGNGLGAFAISNAGVISVADSAKLDFETLSTFPLTVTVTDAGTLSDSAVVTINLTDVFEPPANSLKAGDIVITAINGDNNDEFTFVPLVPLEAGTQIRFTDNGWMSSGAFRTGEGVFLYTAPMEGIPAGTEIGVVKNGTTNAVSFSTTNANQGTIVDETGATAFALSTSGDQLFAFQGSLASPTLLFGLTTLRSIFDSDATSANTSALPASLALSTTAVALGSATSAIDNAEYGDELTIATAPRLLQQIANAENWTKSDTRIDLTYDNFTVLDNTPPAFDSSSYTFVLDENAATDTLLGTIHATDLDAGAILVYSISGTGASDFQIDSSLGQD